MWANSVNANCKHKYISQSPYGVDDVNCSVPGKVLWSISNKMFMKQIFGHSSYPYYVEKIDVKENNKKVWTISNRAFVKKKTYNTRSIASVQKITKEKPNQNFSFAPYAGVASLSALDKVSNVTEQAFSSLGHGFAISWEHIWTPKWSLSLTTAYFRYKFSVSDDRELLGKASFDQRYLGLSLNYQFEKLKLKLGVGSGESLLLSSSGSNNLKIESVLVNNLNLQLNYPLYKFDSGFELSFSSMLGKMSDSQQSDIEVENGSFYGVGLSSTLKKETRNYYIKTAYTQREIESGDVVQRSRRLGVYAGVGFSF